MHSILYLCTCPFLSHNQRTYCHEVHFLIPCLTLLQCGQFVQLNNVKLPSIVPATAAAHLIEAKRPLLLFELQIALPHFCMSLCTDTKTIKVRSRESCHAPSHGSRWRLTKSNCKNEAVLIIYEQRLSFCNVDFSPKMF